jgi:hypothetical protein
MLFNIGLMDCNSSLRALSDQRSVAVNETTLLLEVDPITKRLVEAGKIMIEINLDSLELKQLQSNKISIFL